MTRIFRGLIITLSALFCAATGSFYTTSAQAAASAQRVLDRTDVEAWLDGFVPSSLKAQDVAGAVVVVVKDGKILLSKGYGYSDVAKRTLVTGDKTLFRPGSVSKLFTWTALMQMVEQGKVELDTDINTYLDFKVTGRGGRAITPRHLLTHRAGFEEGVKDMIFFEDGSGLIGTKYLKRWVPKRIFSPGEVPAYSNYGASLAGYIVERVSGMPFETYVERNIFVPLAMNHSSFRQPLPASLRPLMSQGYETGSGPATKFELIPLVAAGALSATGSDMGQFMIAHLQNGQLGTTQILKAETAVMMHSTKSPLIPQLDSMLLGFYQSDVNGHRVIAHAGATLGFLSDFVLFMDDGVGIFLSLNSSGNDAGLIHKSFFEGFADRYFPGGVNRPSVSKGAARDAALIAGEYQSTRRSESSFLAIGNLLSPLNISANSDNSISILGSSEPKRYVHVGPLLWQTVDGKEMLGAKLENGRVRWLSGGSVKVLEPYSAARAPNIWVPLGIVALVTVALAALGWPIAAAARWHFDQPMILTGKSRTTYHLSRLFAVLTLGVTVGWAIVIGSILALGSPADATLILLQLATFLALVGLFGSAAWYARTAWADKRKLAVFVNGALTLSSLILFWITFAHGFYAFTANY